MKRALPVIIALVIALLGFASAFAVNTGVRMALALPEGQSLIEVDPSAAAVAGGSSSESTSPITPRGRTQQQYATVIVGRNIFDSAQIGVKPDDSEGPAITDLNVVLLGTIVARPADFSAALIAQKGSEGDASGYGIHDKIEDAEIVEIQQKRVLLRRGDGREEWLEMQDEATTASTSPGAVASTGDDAGAVEGITKIDDTHYQVDASLIGRYLGDMDALTSMARAIPHRGPDGEIDGYRISGIKRNSPLSQLGIRNGDVIHSVNGQSLASVGDAMGAFQSLQGNLGSGGNFNFDVTRRGSKQTMEYAVK